MSWRPAWTPAVLLAVALAWTWPAASGAALVGHRADALGTAWVLSAAPRLLTSLHDPLTGWPLGADYARPDSWTLLALGAALPGVPAAPLLGALTVLGVFSSAWAAEAFARALGARAPWSLLAGLGYGCSGLAATALVEGYAYQLADPWLPLAGLAWMRALDGEARPGAGLGAAAAFALALATSAWHGLAGALLLGGLAAGALAHGRVRAGGALPGGVLCVLTALVYAGLTFGGSDGAELAAGSGGHARLIDRLLLHTAPAPSVDIDGRGQTAWLPSVWVACALAAPLLFGRDWRVRALAGTAAAAFALALVPLPIEAFGDSGPLAALGAALGRFPTRLGLAGLVAGGPLAARALDELVARHGPRAAPLLLAALVEVFVAPGLPGRPHTTPAGLPSAYAAQRGPVLDLWPEDPGRDPAWELRTTNTACAWQAGHGRPIADTCLLSPGRANPRVVLGRWVTDALLDGRGEAVRERLAALGFATLAWHPDLFREADRARIAAALATLDAAPTVSRDGGDHVAAYAIAAPADAAAARAAWSRFPDG